MSTPVSVPTVWIHPPDLDLTGLNGFLGIEDELRERLDAEEEAGYNQEQKVKQSATRIYETYIKRIDGDTVWSTSDLDAAVTAFSAIIDLYHATRREFDATSETTKDTNTDAESE